MSSNVNRRSLVKGAAWAAPVILASTTVPVYAASSNTCPEVKVTSNIFTRGAFYEQLTDNQSIFGTYGKVDVIFSIPELPEGATVTIKASGPIYPDPMWKIEKDSGHTSATLLNPATSSLTSLRVAYLPNLDEAPVGLKILISTSVQECTEFIPVNDPNQCVPTGPIEPVIEGQTYTLIKVAKERGIVEPDSEDRDKYEHKEVTEELSDGTVITFYDLTEKGREDYNNDFAKYVEEMTALSLELFGTEQPSYQVTWSIDVTDPGPYILIMAETHEGGENMVRLEPASDYIEGDDSGFGVYRLTPVDGKLSFHYNDYAEIHALYSENEACPLISTAFWSSFDSVAT